ncbi:MAG: hypothetical protein K2J89_06340 [Clostridia bacterium]|nr:hypothetical protein [Clostridia bacterium]
MKKLRVKKLRVKKLRVKKLRVKKFRSNSHSLPPNGLTNGEIDKNESGRFFVSWA